MVEKQLLNTGIYWDRPEAYKLHMYTCIVYGLTLRKVYEEKEKKRQRQASTQ